MAEVIAPSIKCRIGEGALYHPDQRAVYWVDIPTGELYRYDLDSEDYEWLPTDQTVGGFTFQADGSVLLFGPEGKISAWDEGHITSVVDQINDEENMRFNDVIADSNGRVFAGTMADNDHSIGRLYRIETDGTTTQLENGVQLPNGMGFSPDDNNFYLVETNTNSIYQYDYNAETGALSNKQVFSRPNAEWNYDGLTVDESGYIWVGLWGGSAVARLNDEGNVENVFEVPAENITTLTFGGEDYQTAYVTSASYDAPLTDVDAGRLFRIKTDVRGRPENYSRIQL